MPQSIADKFLAESSIKSFDLQHREIMNKRVDNDKSAFEKGIRKFNDLENSKKKANLIKWKVIENLDRYLVEFEKNFTSNGGTVIWANDAEEAREEIGKIIEKRQAKSVIKSKSMTSEEIDLHQFLDKKGISTTESDLGDFILQLIDQKSYHFSSPAMHLTTAEIAKLFHEKFDTPLDYTAEQLSVKARELLREKYASADIGITGANFLVAETGSISISENEGNVRLITAFPKVHIAIVGIDQIIPSLNDLDLFWSLFASHETGQNLSTYNNILSGPRKEKETDGPEEMYVILLDNGRTKLLEKKEQRQGLYCIRCGACLNACPVFQNIGGQVYGGSQLQGPIGSLMAPHLYGMKAYKHLSEASTLSISYNEVCPVSIDISRMLLLNRRDAVKEGLAAGTEVKMWKSFTFLAKNRKWMDFFGGKIKNLITRYFFKKAWGKQRDLPKFAKKSFAKQWKEQQKNKE